MIALRVCAKHVPQMLMLGGFLWGVFSDRKATAFDERKGSSPSGMEIIGDPKTSAALQELSEKIATLEEGDATLRNQILALQDSLAARHKNVASLVIEVEVRNRESSGREQTPAIGLVELAASLNGIPLVHYRNPSSSSPNATLPIYKGPVPTGNYELRVNGVVGILPYGWPHALPQGQWVVDSTNTIKVDSGVPRAIKVILRPGQPKPELVLETVAENRR